MIPLRVLRLVLVIAAVSISGKALAQESQPVSPAPGDSHPGLAQPAISDESEQHLAAGDLVEVSVYNVPELNTKARISSAGEIYLPLVDYVRISGLTAEGAQSKIEQLLSDGGFVKNPHVSIVVDQSTSQSVNVLGEVAKPGIYPVVGQPNLLDMISAAGGFTERAGKSMSIVRKGESNPIVVPISRNLADSAKESIPIHPGDLIVVRKADVVYVVGDVGRPTGLQMDSGHLTVLQAIALAGGTTRTAKVSGARIIRKGESGSFETAVPLQKILEAKVPDPQLQAEDILFIPSSRAKIIAGRTMEAAMQAATAASILAIQ
jgi:polysaccharide export outer membrane protein